MGLLARGWATPTNPSWYSPLAPNQAKSPSRRPPAAVFNVMVAGRRVLRPARSNKMESQTSRRWHASKSCCLLTPRNPKEVGRRWH